MSGEKYFSRDEEMALIELVSHHKCLYDGSDKKYRDNIAKDNVWKEIANYIEGKTGMYYKLSFLIINNKSYY